MDEKIVRKVLDIEGMTCTGCEMRIENVLRKLDGMVNVKAIYSSSNVYVTYDINKLDIIKVVEAIEKLDYKVKSGVIEAVPEQDKKDAQQKGQNKINAGQTIGIVIIVLALYTIIKNTVGFNFIPQVDQSMGYGILFVVGLLTSLHCIAMCGGINLSVCMQYRIDSESKIDRIKPGALYNLGRVLSYTVIGGIVGALGSVISFSGTAKGIVAILSGIFMVIMGLNMLNIFPWLRRLNPRLPKFFGRNIQSNTGKKGPFLVGLLNGLMPCGPLQAMQLYALGTGSFASGAISMFLFSLGTVPLMFGFGAVSSLISGKFTHKMMKVSSILIIILGIIMLNRGLNLSGYDIALAMGNTGGSGNIAKIENGVQQVTTKLQSGSYQPIVVQKGIPVKWTISADKENLNGCNNAINAKEFGIENRKLKVGDNVIEFTPQKEGTFVYSCWMGMISSNIKVVADVTKASEIDVRQSDNSGRGGLSVGGGCCAAGAKAVKFARGKVPTDDIKVASVKNDQQEVTITVNDYGYSPAVVVLQKGVKAKIKFNNEKLNSCNNIVIFPEYGGQLKLEDQAETPWLTPEKDFAFQCWMGMLHGYIKVVDDINNVNIDDIKKEVGSYKPAGGFGGGGCCGG